MPAFRFFFKIANELSRFFGGSRGLHKIAGVHFRKMLFNGFQNVAYDNGFLLIVGFWCDSCFRRI